MKTERRNKRKKQKGITLIGLVITIVALLILAGVSIATLTGEKIMKNVPILTVTIIVEWKNYFQVTLI